MDLSRWGRIAGADEAGRGPLAGPVVAAAAVLTPAQEEELLSLGLTDSKKLTPRRREFLFERMLFLKVRWRAQAASPARIDGMNILRASLWAMGRSVEKLPPCFDTVIVDGTFPLPGLSCPQVPLPKADSLIPAAAAASVAAKVLRDRIMDILDGLYPGYGFKKNKGYPTVAHRKALEALGPSAVHRAGFTWRAP
ncbi:Ribonuclease HII [bioreactor metagenome]|jgi:ribonuclease HII|uniref:Ribonuclease HII n=1 Tax=bioreactor metagenome TaxID=1076179 RepID=A0A644VNK4_9ZZZZ|nr:ribonuclease HII [Aminivibrio sp.]MEA4952018.1 ribonuclease HII [Aminivibrio sp.]NCB16490.1 ribonuclease HII [Synergistales bacterium]HPF83783.1 ribonuclease HII [Aminivibrio sp.]HRX25331.1 ribonuclease HII [Aminivibrio sp.]